MLKSSTATMLNRSRSYSSPKASSSQAIERWSERIAKATLPAFLACTKMRRATFLPLIVVNESSHSARSPATRAKR
jgi:hypothetical protein